MAESDVKKDIDALRSDIDAIRTDMKDIVESVKDLGKHSGAAAKDRAQSELEKRLEQLSEAYEAVRDKGNRAADSFHDNVEEHPLTAILVSFGVGMIAAKVLSWK